MAQRESGLVKNIKTEAGCTFEKQREMFFIHVKVNNNGSSKIVN